MDRDEIALQLRDSLERVRPDSLDHGVIVARATERRRRRRGVIGAALGLAAIAAVVIAIVGGPSEGPLGPPTVEASAGVTLPGAVVGTAVQEGEYLWLLTCSTGCAGPPLEREARGSLVKIDNRSGEIVAATAIADPGVVAVGEGAVWTASPGGVVTRFDPQTARAVAAVRLTLPKPITPTAQDAFSFLPNGIAVGGGAVWVSTAREYVAQIDPETMEVRRMIPTRYMVSGMAFGGGSVWLSGGLFGLGRINPATGRLSPAQPIEDAEGRQLQLDYLTVADGSLWARGAWGPLRGTRRYVPRQAGDLSLARLNLQTGDVEQMVSFDAYISVHAVSGPYLWLAGRDSPTGSRDVVYVLSAGADEIVLAARLAQPGTIVGAIGTSLWVARPGDVLERYEVPIG